MKQRVLKVRSVASLYRQHLQQARLFAHIWQDPVLYASHRTIARARFEDFADAARRFAASQAQQKAFKNSNEPAPRGDSVIRVQALKATRLKNAVERHSKKLVDGLDSARAKLKQLAAANVGWPHAVVRALNAGYARSGYLRHKLLQPFLPKHDPKTNKGKASPRTGKAPEQPRPTLARRQQSPLVSRSLRSLIISEATHAKTTPATIAQLELPPKLVLAMQKKAGLFPSENEAVAALEGMARNLQAIGITRAREANARWRWLTDHLAKIQPPFEMADDQEPSPEMADMVPRRQLSAIESKIASRKPTVPKRMHRLQANPPPKGVRDFEEFAPFALMSPTSSSQGPRSSPRYLEAARRAAVDLGRGSTTQQEEFQDAPLYPPIDPRPSKKQRAAAAVESTKYNLVAHGGWARSGPVDFERQHRARRRMWADLLSRLPEPVYKEDEGPMQPVEGAAISVIASEPDIALPDVGADDDDDATKVGAETGSSRRPALPTLQARSPAYRLAPAREWKFWADYELDTGGESEQDSAPPAEKTESDPQSDREATSKTSKGQSGPSATPKSADKDTQPRPQSENKPVSRRAATSVAPLRRSEYAHGSTSLAKPDSHRWVRPDELLWLESDQPPGEGRRGGKGRG